LYFLPDITEVLKSRGLNPLIMWKNSYKILVGKHEARKRTLEDLGRDGRIMLKFVLEVRV